MITFNQTTDATCAYRETSGVRTVRMDLTGNAGSLLEIMRDATIVIGGPSPAPFDVKIPGQPTGDIDALAPY